MQESCQKVRRNYICARLIVMTILLACSANEARYELIVVRFHREYRTTLCRSLDLVATCYVVALRAHNIVITINSAYLLYTIVYLLL
jgi:hypothetical protein